MAFAKDLTENKSLLEQQNYLHLEDVLSDEFKDVLEWYGREITENRLDEIDEWHIAGKKKQFLFDFPSQNFLDGFCKSIAQITGHSGKDITIGERHIKVYLEEAKDFPAPHMDRQAAEFTIGFPIHIASNSRVCFFPHLSRKENTGEKACYATVSEGCDMAQFYDDERIVKMKGKVGDMFIFHGSTIFHERIKAAGSIILYIKINASNRDPLGEHASLLKSLRRKSVSMAA